MREEEACPFCRTVLKTGATVCASCGANKRGNGCGCVVALGIGLSALLAMDWVRDGYIGEALGAAGVTLLLVALSRSSVTKPRWYRRNV